MEDSIQFAKKYLEDLLSFFGLNIDVYATRDDDVIELSVPSTHLNGFLIGQHGDTLRALQFMVSTALKNNNQELTRVNVDVADYKRHRNDRLAEKAQGWIDDVRKNKSDKVLPPMNAADRRVVHKAVSDASGVESTSDGVGRDRHVVIKPIGDSDEPEEVDEPAAPATETEQEPEAESTES